ncbi:UDP-N-acetylmuramoyl-tripeptide--D-alanyl-D-alanine ligase [Methylobacillus caricis]|uniref:UDP-N-acetylmuramoyl-tripeptide--D-alanyl-D- alanine ligase n=1 Tax=Methylobacillus caricis TaxID=1971611 RepID=UPI001CFFE647|nr:UDP-N-acetylmuramoyl-tripeptide--D-alanyl-D-alanine ligase [Methylobacillus caricis]MCB5188589.1 UDP-N-acetylmuramoyl-tripeptide--D-alanyl-D-alanine ligase [Methylobacillus caricis]
MMRLSEAAIATKGQVLGNDVLFSSVGTDSRKLEPQQLFIALHGDRFDGHDYVSQVLEGGAAAVMVSDDSALARPALLVKDTRRALGDLAACWRSKFKIPLAAITGSNGKTTVKEMLAAILRVEAGADDRVLATQGNLNNDLGLPLTLLRLRGEHRFAVTEMGMNHFGEISYLTNIGKPDVALINNATSAHLGGLGSVEGVAHAKGEIFEGLADSGIAVINADDVHASLWQSLAAKHQVVTFGLDDTADVYAQYELKADISELVIHTPKGTSAVTLPVAGLHNVRNALAATAVALSMGASLLSVSTGLTGFAGVNGRLQRKTGLNAAVLIDDTYNANPASMHAAVDVLSQQAGRRLLIIGDMGELGADEQQLHQELGAYARQAGIQRLFALGDLSRNTVLAFGDSAGHYGSVDELVAAVKPWLDATTTVLIKGSRFMRMERVVALLQDETEKP